MQAVAGLGRRQPRPQRLEDQVLGYRAAAARRAARAPAARRRGGPRRPPRRPTRARHAEVAEHVEAQRGRARGEAIGPREAAAARPGSGSSARPASRSRDRRVARLGRPRPRAAPRLGWSGTRPAAAPGDRAVDRAGTTAVGRSPPARARPTQARRSRTHSRRTSGQRRRPPPPSTARGPRRRSSRSPLVIDPRPRRDQPSAVVLPELARMWSSGPLAVSSMGAASRGALPTATTVGTWAAAHTRRQTRPGATASRARRSRPPSRPARGRRHARLRECG